LDGGFVDGARLAKKILRLDRETNLWSGYPCRRRGGRRGRVRRRGGQDANEEIVRELILVGETRGGDDLKASKEIAVSLVALGNDGD
jgi:hypothetical protein